MVSGCAPAFAATITPLPDNVQASRATIDQNFTNLNSGKLEWRGSVTTAARDALGTPAAGDFVYNTTTARYEGYDGSGWVAVSGPAETGDSATGFFPAGEIELPRGGTGADLSGYVGFVGVSGGAVYEGNTIGELEGAIGNDNIILETELDTQEKAAGLRTDLVAASVTGATDGQGNGAQTAQRIFITGGAANTCVTLDGLFVGAVFVVDNETTTAKKVYPESGDNIGEGLNNAITVPAGEILTVVATDADNANHYLTATPQFSFALTVDDVADSMDYMIGYVHAAFTVKEVVAVHAGTGLSSPDVDVTYKHHTDRSNAGNTIIVDTVTSSTTGNSEVSGWTDETIPAASWIWIETSSLSGTTDNLEIIVRGTYD